MEGGISLIFYLAIFVIQIILLVKSIKNKKRKLWGTLIILEIFCRFVKHMLQ